MPRGKTWCDGHLSAMIAACDAATVQLGNGPGDLFRTRHNPCGAVVDVTLPMIRRGGWVCRWCKEAGDAAKFAALPIAGNNACLVGAQESILAAAGMRSLLPLMDQTQAEPLNVECLECGAAQAQSPYSISEGVRLSWLPCERCNTSRFAITTDTVRRRLEAVAMRLTSEWQGDKAAHLEAICERCGLARSMSWQSLASGSPPCLSCDGATLDPELPHRVYLIEFPNLGKFGVYKVGITHDVHDRRLRDHEYAGGRVMATVTVPSRATALTVERHVLRSYLPRAFVVLPVGVLPRGGVTECWDALAGYPDLRNAASAANVTVLRDWEP